VPVARRKPLEPPVDGHDSHLGGRAPASERAARPDVLGAGPQLVQALADLDQALPVGGAGAQAIEAVQLHGQRALSFPAFPHLLDDFARTAWARPDGWRRAGAEQGLDFTQSG
jgi:hypothetical protein